jgi:hypothetical protein
MLFVKIYNKCENTGSSIMSVKGFNVKSIWDCGMQMHYFICTAVRELCLFFNCLQESLWCAPPYRPHNQRLEQWQLYTKLRMTKAQIQRTHCQCGVINSAADVSCHGLNYSEWQTNSKKFDTQIFMSILYGCQDRRLVFWLQSPHYSHSSRFSLFQDN